MHSPIGAILRVLVECNAALLVRPRTSSQSFVGPVLHVDRRGERHLCCRCSRSPPHILLVFAVPRHRGVPGGVTLAHIFCRSARRRALFSGRGVRFLRRCSFPGPHPSCNNRPEKRWFPRAPEFVVLLRLSHCINLHLHIHIHLSLSRSLSLSLSMISL